ncbi:SprT family zinc-dependent metalloprotease [Alkalihalophilus marmarensis]|uniref:M48 family metallopeptidase n=1 Tax=Alkalihalophilus marmarensis TaxID=521377 RepID=UPI002E2453D7|nr:SprT family zinc-dependent metalloprotease [Alkalihalophilus marmarensis]
MPYFDYGNTTIEYELLHNSDKKDISIAIDWVNGVTITTPPDISNQQLQKILHKKAPWILNKWKAFNEITDKPSPKEFISGEKFPYLGRHYRLKVIRTEESAESGLSFNRGRFIAVAPKHCKEEERKEELFQAFKQWYCLYGSKKINERLHIYSEKMNVSPLKLQLKEQKMRWGTCTPEGAIYINWRVTMAPISIIDYLLVHELAHLKHQNHSKDFWQLVRSILPDYEERKEWLRVNGPTLTL